MPIALLGATSHIAKGLLDCWAREGGHQLYLYARSPERVAAFLQTIPACDAKLFELEAFGRHDCEVVINCIGFGSPQRLQHHIGDIFTITSCFDDRIIAYLQQHPRARYINLSSGAALGPDFSQPATELSEARFPANQLTTESFYGIAKLHAEARHRALPHLAIIDLRVFGYFSRFIDPNDSFLLCEITACLRSGTPFITNATDIVRDFGHPHDLHHLISCCLTQQHHNQVYDLYSRKPVSKFELLTFCAEHFGLQYEVQEAFVPPSVTGSKSHYYSLNHAAQRIGYQPAYSALEGVALELEHLLMR